MGNAVGNAASNVASNDATPAMRQVVTFIKEIAPFMAAVEKDAAARATQAERVAVLADNLAEQLATKGLILGSVKSATALALRDPEQSLQFLGRATHLPAVQEVHAGAQNRGQDHGSQEDFPID